MTRYVKGLLIGAVSLALFAMQASAQQVGTDADACRSLVPAAMGGPVPQDKNTILLRWLATSNYELVYRGQVILLDAYFEQGPRSRPTGVVPNGVGKTDAGHAHFDHISDV